jgi:SynChlorMet cassette protein ScmC
MKNPTPPSKKQFAELALADGSIWNIFAANDRAYDVVSALAKAMQLQSLDKSAPNKSSFSTPRRLIVHVESHKTNSVQLSSTIHLTFEDENTIVCNLISEENNEMAALLLVHLSGIICRDVQYRGGILLHGALAGWNENGVILAGPGGRGKTTASKRLPYHWQSFCDDTTLVICDNKSEYRAHPWPTWSTFMFNGPGGTWNVQHSVFLKGIFFLDQAPREQIESLGAGHATCLLIESFEQASRMMSHYMEKEELREHRKMCFDNICLLAQTVPSYILRLGPDGAFWKEIEWAITG